MAAGAGTERVAHRPRYQRAPDAIPVRLADGTVLCLESKERAELPKWLFRDSIGQARSYVVGAVPVVVVTELGGKQFAVLPYLDFMRIAGVQPAKADEQLVLGRSA